MVFLLFWIINTLQRYDVWLQSEGAEGRIAVAVYSPLEERKRYKSGAPIGIYIPGADDKGNLNNPFPLLEDIIGISFLFPGGKDPLTGRESDGIYDHRGMNCIKALRDVIKYATGKLKDVNGKYLNELIPVNPLYENVGIVGSSNGGNIAIVTLGLFGDEAEISWYVGWENPAGEQFVTVDLGSFSEPNPRYIPYSGRITENGIICDVDYRDLKFDPDAIHPKKHYQGVLYHDLNSNDVFDKGIDYALGAIEGIFEGNLKWVHSTEALKAAKGKGLPDPLGPDFASLEEAREFWKIRDLSKMFDSVIIKNPELKVILIGTEVDHVQGTPDYPHIVLHYQGWNTRGIQWIRLLPDSCYVAYVAKQNLKAKDNNANEDITLYNIIEFLQPEEVSDKYSISAAILELSDRVYFNRWEENLQNVLTGIKEENITSTSIIKKEFNSFVLYLPYKKPISITLFDITGRKIKEFKNQKKKKLLIHNVPSGVYLLKIEGKNINQIKKVLILE